MFAAIENALKQREEQLAARAKRQQQQQEAAQHAPAPQPKPPQPPTAKPPLAAPLGNPGPAAATAFAGAVGRSPDAPGGGAAGSEEDGCAGGRPETPSVTSQLRDALVAEVSGLADNVQEVCSMIRADTAALAHPNGALTDSPRKQANEVRRCSSYACILLYPQ